MAAVSASAQRPGEWDAAYDRLKARIAKLGGAVVAFSGGVDSSLLLAAAQDALGDRALAVTACSATYPDHEKEQALMVARLLGARHLLIDTQELEDDAYRQNPPNRCYFCKRELFQKLSALAAQEGLGVVLDGSNADDPKDYRPGHQAALELGVVSPLAELGLGKAEIRKLAKLRGLPNWSQPACACLASRIPYGQEITPARLNRIARAESAIRDLGFSLVRVRDHGEIARLEIAKEEIDRALQFGLRALVVNACRMQGYTYVCLDLEGYRTGAMNEVLGPARGGPERAP